jgi:hypothetical protein
MRTATYALAPQASIATCHGSPPTAISALTVSVGPSV